MEILHWTGEYLQPNRDDVWSTVEDVSYGYEYALTPYRQILFDLLMAGF